MRKLSKLIYSNKIFASVMLMLQLLLLYTFYIWLRDYVYYFIGIQAVFGGVLIMYEINRDEEPEFKITWLMLIALVPLFGALLYIYIHISLMTGDMRRRQEFVRRESGKCLPADEEIIAEIASNDAGAGGLARYLTLRGGSPAFKNTSVKYYPLGELMIEDIKRELEKAEKFIFIEFFIINHRGRVWSEILDILKRKAEAGVEVRVMFDGMGCMTTLPRGYAEQMRKYGIKCRIFSPIQPLLSTYQNNRDHRKIIVIDGRCSFSGGVNLADEYANYINRFGHWKDTGVKLTGEATAGFTKLFLEMWNVENINDNEAYGEYISVSEKYSAENTEGYIIPYGDDPLDHEYVGKRVYIDNLNNASEYVNIMTPYLVLDQEMMESMKYAVGRGVEVNIIMPHIPDKKYAFWLARTYYPQLIRSGVNIYEYTPGFVHAKVSSADGIRAVVGTINLDYRSLYLHYECAAYLYNVPQIADIDSDYRGTLKKCVKITMQEYKKFPVYTKFFGQLIKLFAPLL